MKENKLSTYITGRDDSGIEKDGDDATYNIEQPTNKAPCIVIKGFSSVQAFLAWFNIIAPQPLIFPREQGRSIQLLHDCIIINGFADLEEMLLWFGGDDFNRPTVIPQAQHKDST